MRKQEGLSRIDIAVALACIVLVLAQAAILNAGGRERSKKEVCLVNLKTLAAAWQTYTNDNNFKIPVGDVGYSWSFPGGTLAPQLAWVEWPHKIPHPMPPSYSTNWSGGPGMGNALSWSAVLTARNDILNHAISEGTLWKYTGDYNLYRCPSAAANQYQTYYMSQSMNCYPGTGGTGSVDLRNINQITKSAERFVFLDTGSYKLGAFYVAYSSGGGGSGPGKWYDLPPKHHSMGTTFSFADGHAIYRQWTDPHTITSQPEWGGGTVDYCDCDLRWMTKITWGNITYSCSDPAKNCEY